MGRRVAIEFKCDRCPNVWYEDFDVDAKQPAKEPPGFKAKLGDRVVEFETLCDTCVKTCSNYMDNIAKDLKRKPGGKKDSPPAKEKPPKATPPSTSRRSTVSTSVVHGDGSGMSSTEAVDRSS